MSIWAAVPSPLTTELKVDTLSVERMIESLESGGVTGVFLAGTCGEGPWLPDRERARLVSTVASRAKGRLKIAVQATDNSVPRILDNIRQAQDAGADYAIIAAPATFMNATSERVAGLFLEAAQASPLPVGIYDLGRHRPVVIPIERLKEIYLQPNVVLVKDSSGAPERRAEALGARAAKPELQLFNGNEFRCLEYLRGGYDGIMFGGAVATAPQLQRIVELFIAGRLEEAEVVENQMKANLYGIYGGEALTCWLTGLKYYLVRRGVFSSPASYLGYPLTEQCRAFIEHYAAREEGARSKQASILAPDR